MAENAGARLRAIRARRDQITTELSAHKDQLAALKSQGIGGAERRELKAKVKALRAERDELKLEASALKQS